MEHVEKTAKDYKKYLQIDLNSAVSFYISKKLVII